MDEGVYVVVVYTIVCGQQGVIVEFESTKSAEALKEFKYYKDHIQRIKEGGFPNDYLIQFLSKEIWTNNMKLLDSFDTREDL